MLTTMIILLEIFSSAFGRRLEKNRSGAVRRRAWNKCHTETEAVKFGLSIGVAIVPKLWERASSKVAKET